MLKLKINDQLISLIIVSITSSSGNRTECIYCFYCRIKVLKYVRCVHFLQYYSEGLFTVLQTSETWLTMRDFSTLNTQKIEQSLVGV